MTDIKFETVESQASYGIGLELGHQLKSGGLKDYLISEAITAGIFDALTDKVPAVEINAIHNALRELQQRTEPLRQDMAKQSAERNKQFLEQNKQRAEVTTMASGLQYQVIKAGDGQRPAATDKVRLHFTGKNIDGHVFDSSEARNEPVEFVVSSTVPGLQEALTSMPVGSKWQVYIPSHLGYGEQNGGAMLPPNSTLVFDLELLAIL